METFQNSKSFERKFYSNKTNDFISILADSIFFEPPTVHEIISCIDPLNANRVVRFDNIPANFLKVAASIIDPYLGFLIGYAFSNGIFLIAAKLLLSFLFMKKGKKIIKQF